MVGCLAIPQATKSGLLPMELTGSRLLPRRNGPPGLLLQLLSLKASFGFSEAQKTTTSVIRIALRMMSSLPQMARIGSWNLRTLRGHPEPTTKLLFSMIKSMSLEVEIMFQNTLRTTMSGLPQMELTGFRSLKKPLGVKGCGSLQSFTGIIFGLWVGGRISPRKTGMIPGSQRMAKTGLDSMPNPVGRKGMSTPLLFSKINSGSQAV